MTTAFLCYHDHPRLAREPPVEWHRKKSDRNGISASLLLELLFGRHSWPVC